MLLEQKGIPFKEIRVDLGGSGIIFKVNAGHRTVPQIYYNDQVFVEGGYQGLAKLNESAFQELKEKINAH